MSGQEMKTQESSNSAGTASLGSGTIEQLSMTDIKQEGRENSPAKMCGTVTKWVNENETRAIAIAVLLILAVIAAIATPVSIKFGVRSKSTEPPVNGTRQPKIKISCGYILGKEEDGVDVFKGIPYDRPPVGTNRWNYSSLKSKLAYCFPNNYEAYEFKDPCVQAADYGTGSATSGSEDCLYLNIWKPSLPQNNKTDDANATGDAGLRPVFVYFHGGFLRHGSGNASPTRPTAALAKELNAVIVSFNYRLNIFGFLSLKVLQVDFENSYRYGNYGLMDQIVALTWIQENIIKFGGNPEMVTVGGLDGGATSILALLASPYLTDPKQLFHRAWLSGGATIFPVTRVQADHSGSELQVVMDCKKECLDQRDVTQCNADCLRGKDVNAIWSHYAYFAVRSSESDMQIPLSSCASLPPPTAVIVDGHVVGQDPISFVAIRNIPLLIGTNSHETNYAVDPPHVVSTSCQFLEMYLQIEGRSKELNVSHIEELRRLYPCSQTDPKESSSNAYIQMATDIRSTCPYNKLAEVAGLGQHAPPVYRYVSTVAPSVPTDLFGMRYKSEFPTHGFDMVTFFGNIDSRSEGDHLGYQSTIRGIVRTFIHGGNLTTKYNMTSDGRRANVLANGGHITALEQAYGAERCRFWNSGAFNNGGWSN